jgi:hypothetical protein
MVYTNWHTVAGNGRAIGASVELLDTDDAPHRWYACATVDATTMAFSHHASRKAAEAWAEGMHKSYLEVHAR